MEKTYLWFDKNFEMLYEPGEHDGSFDEFDFDVSI